MIPRVRIILTWQLLNMIDTVQSTQLVEKSFLPTRAHLISGESDNEFSMETHLKPKYPVQEPEPFWTLVSRSLAPVMEGRDPGRMLAEVTWKILEPYIRECRFYLITQDTQSLFVFFTGRYTSASSIPFILYDVSLLEQDSYGDDPPFTWRGIQSTCQVFLIDMAYKNTIQLSRFLQRSGIWFLPEAKIFLLGRKQDVNSVLWIPAFRSSVYVLYLAVDDSTPQPDAMVTIYSRCLFCTEELGMVRVLASWRLGSRVPEIFSPFPNKIKSFHGRLLKATVTAGPYFPYMDFESDLTNLSNRVTLKDSLSKRLTDTMSSAFNFTYEAYKPTMQSFEKSAQKNGSWIDMVQILHEGKVDISLMMTTGVGRLPFIDLGRVCESDPLVIVTLRPQLLPQYLAIVRPFTANVWLYLIASLLLWSISIWTVDKTSSKFTGNRSRSLSSYITYGFAAILGDPPPKPPKNSAGRLLVGGWLVAALVISRGFTSSLVAFLSVPGKIKPIDTYEELLAQTSWHWGIHDVLLAGQSKVYLTNDEDPTLKQIYEKSEPISIEEGLAKISTLRGNYALIGSKTVIRTAAAPLFADQFRQSFIYISRRSYKAVTDFGWGFRKGSPYYDLLLNALNRLTDAGIIGYWIEDIVNRRVQQIRKEKKTSWAEEFIGNLEPDINRLFDNDNRTLRTRHMIGIYLVMLGGFALATVNFLAERLIHRYRVTK